MTRERKGAPAQNARWDLEKEGGRLIRYLYKGPQQISIYCGKKVRYFGYMQVLKKVLVQY
jgi:hypothetical protein